MTDFKKLVILVILSFCVFRLTAQDSGNSADLLSKAEEAFRTGNDLLEDDPDSAAAAYSKAVDYYNSIIKSGTGNAELYYNLGNSYFRLEKIGYAILNYRRALLFEPGNRRIEFNLNYARSLQKNNFSADTEKEVLHILFFWHYLVPVFWKYIIFAVANLVLWSGLILKRMGRDIGTAPTAASLAIVLLFGGSFIVDVKNSGRLHGVVTAESTTGRLGDSRSYEPVFDAPLYQGIEFSIEQKRPGWLLAKLPGGQLAWLEDADCGIVEEVPH